MVIGGYFGELQNYRSGTSHSSAHFCQMSPRGTIEGSDHP